MADFSVVASAALAGARELLPAWLPGGKFRGHEYYCGSIQGGAGDSFSVNINNGRWQEHNGGDPSGGDLVALYSYIFGIDNQGIACNALAKELGIMNGRDYAPTQAIADTEPPPASMHDFPTNDPSPNLFSHSRFGQPAAVWLYKTDHNVPRGAIARYPSPGGGKEIVPWIFDGTRYRARAFDKPRMLYGLDKLAIMPQARVLLVEGEKAAQAAQELFPGRPCMTWPGGTGGWRHADWAPLDGLQVTIWPDNDEAGRLCAAAIAAFLLKRQCRVWIVDPSEFGEKWDIADHQGTAAELLTYAKAHTKEVVVREKVIEAPPPKPAPAPARVKELPAPSAEVVEQAPPPGSAVAMWQHWGLALKNEGRRPYLDMGNIVTILEAMKVDCYWDLFAYRLMWQGCEMSDAAVSYFHVFLQRKAGMRDLSESTVRDGIKTYAFSHARDPAREWLDGLKWDGTHRLHLLMSKGFGAPQNKYTHCVSQNFITGMVARIYHPGCKADCMPIFEGSQGVGKSRALSILGGEYFAEVHESMATKDFYMAITGKMLVELGELNSLHGQTIKRVKGIIANPVDRYRAPYARAAADHPRRCVFAGTTNEYEWNVDETGARRFWPILCTKIDHEWLAREREQIFAEGVARYQSGGKWWQLPQTMAKEQTEARRPSDPWDPIVSSYCRPRPEVDTLNLAVDGLDFKPADVTNAVQKRLASILLHLGYESVRRRNDQGKQYRVWVRAREPGSDDDL